MFALHMSAFRGKADIASIRFAIRDFDAARCQAATNKKEETSAGTTWVLNGLAILPICGALFIGAAIAIAILGSL